MSMTVNAVVESKAFSETGVGELKGNATPTRIITREGPSALTGTVLTLLSRVAGWVKSCFTTRKLTDAERVVSENRVLHEKMRGLVDQIVKTFRVRIMGYSSNPISSSAIEKYIRENAKSPDLDLQVANLKKQLEKRSKLFEQIAQIGGNQSALSSTPKSFAEIAEERETYLYFLSFAVKEYLLKNATSADFDLQLASLKKELKAMFIQSAQEVSPPSKAFNDFKFLWTRALHEFMQSGEFEEFSYFNSQVEAARVDVAYRESREKFAVNGSEAAAQLVQTLKRGVMDRKILPLRAVEGLARSALAIQKELSGGKRGGAGALAAEQIRNEAIKAGLITVKVCDQLRVKSLLKPEEWGRGLDEGIKMGLITSEVCNQLVGNKGLLDLQELGWVTGFKEEDLFSCTPEITKEMDRVMGNLLRRGEKVSPLNS